MKRLKQISILVLALFLMTPGNVEAQKRTKILGTPEAFKRPIDHFENPEMLRNYLNGTKNQDKKRAWIVFSDRDENPVYADKSTTTAKGTINLGDFFYVLSDETDWIEIGTATARDGLKAQVTKVGWVQKNKMILWSYGLIDEKTEINKKAFLLNRGDEAEDVLLSAGQNKHLSKEIYRDPTQRIKAESEKIYSFFFVYKKEGDMYLLSRDAKLNASARSKKKLIGWINKRDLQEWNTRLCLEPNYNQAAYDERRDNRNLRARAFFDQKGLIGISTTSPGNTDYEFKKDDPAYFTPEEVSPADEKRLKGTVMRYPLFSTSAIEGVDYYNTGAIGNSKVAYDKDGKIKFESEIPENAMAQMDEFVDNYIKRNQKINIFFVIEGTDNTHANKAQIISMLNGLKSNPALNESSGKTVQYGALIYRDVPEGERVVAIESLSQNMGNVTDFIAKEEFKNVSDRDDWTSLLYALQEATLKAGFNEEAVNVMIVMGGASDFSQNKARLALAKSNTSKEYLDQDARTELKNDLVRYRMNIHGIQLYNNGNTACTKFPLLMKAVILRPAQEQFNRSETDEKFQRYLSKNDEISWGSPVFNLDNFQETSSMEGSMPGIIVKPVDTQVLSQEKLITGVDYTIESTLKVEDGFVDLLHENFKEGEKLDIKRFSEENGLEFTSISAPYAMFMAKLFKEVKIPEEYIQNTSGLKLNLYTRVYIPIKPTGAEHKTFSQVLFMPYTDVKAYHSDLKNSIQAALGAANGSDKREALHDMFINLIGKLAGEEMQKKGDDLSTSDVARLQQGIYKAGLDRNEMSLDDFGPGLRIGDLLSNKKVSDEQITTLLSGFEKVEEGLLEVLRNEDYPFQMKTNRDNTYYWLRIDQVFAL